MFSDVQPAWMWNIQIVEWPLFGDYAQTPYLKRLLRGTGTQGTGGFVPSRLW